MKKIKETCIIDDDAISVFGLKRAIRSIGLETEVSVFENGLDALDNFRQRIANNIELPESILIDLNMPVMDGWGFLIEYGKLPVSHSAATIFIMTSSINPKDLEKAKTYTSQENYLMKPVTAKKLKSLLL